MITELRLSNFKPFEKQVFKFKPLTLLSGLNSSGKSSVLQSLLLLRQSYQQGLLPNESLNLNGDLVCIGTGQDALFEGASKEDFIGFDIVWEEAREGIWRFSYNRESGVLKLASPPVNSEIYLESLFTKKFHYLQAERLGSRQFFEISDYQVRQLGQLGTRGEYNAHFLTINDKNLIPNEKLSHPDAKSLELRAQAQAWMREISPGIRLNSRSSRPNMDLVSLQYSYGDSNPYRSTNVGFGITYTLPIIVAVLASTPGTLILIENPEAHLHPRGQTQIGRLLALAASCGVQIVIETHSDHILNGILLTVHSGKVAPKEVQLYFLQKNQQDQTEVLSPRIHHTGRLDRWPDGFFDEWNKSLDALLEPAGE